MYNKEATYDKQGMLFHSMCKQAGWSNQAIQAYLTKKYNTTHFNALNYKQKRQVIATIKHYADKASETNAKKMRQKIVAIWCKHGLTVDELHEYMEAWGFGDSMRKCTLIQLKQIMQYVHIITNGSAPPLPPPAHTSRGGQNENIQGDKK